jgi:hypothetical protein
MVFLSVSRIPSCSAIRYRCIPWGLLGFRPIPEVERCRSSADWYRSRPQEDITMSVDAPECRQCQLVLFSVIWLANRLEMVTSDLSDFMAVDWLTMEHIPILFFCQSKRSLCILSRLVTGIRSHHFWSITGKRTNRKAGYKKKQSVDSIDTKSSFY